MSVHVAELHSDVVPTGGPASTASSGGGGAQKVWGSELESWQGLRCDAARLAGRTASEGYDD
ncbi:hypothetical protein [Kutzneria sp. CA-103260]|uniref:hypothetical protein n=1 Tax=Kutzneria sp. CA-103260 TaxID=2802641 RepID=UPI001BA89C84|nr:hypothetical protein [Kutzneria sp. CA-103260]QUQ63879.1 hypothetical protein JJ691_15960 [Kutzneria sp. CA-103260]